MWIKLKDENPTRQNYVRQAFINSMDISAIVEDEIYENSCNIVLQNGEKLFCGVSAEEFFSYVWKMDPLKNIRWNGQNLVKRKK